MKPSEHPRRTESEPASTGRESRPLNGYECDQCGRHFEGTPASSGLFLWTRGEETRVEEPPLCEVCATQSSMGALFRWSIDDGGDEG